MAHPSRLVQQRASDAAFVLREEFPDRLTVDQRIRMEVIGLVAPERLGLTQVGDALATYCHVVKARQ